MKRGASAQAQLKGLSNAKYGYLFSIPFIVAYLIFSFYPTIYTAVLGFTDCHGLGNNDWHLLEHPFENFKIILNSQTFIQSVKNTIVIWLMNFIPQITLAMVLTAWFTARRNTIKGQGLFKVIFYMPNIITAATIALLFNTLFGFPVGPVNSFLVNFGLRDSGFYFLNSKWAAKIIVAFIQFWIWYGYTMIILISGVLGINPDIYEAADIDGANGAQTFFQITIPNLKSILLFTLVTSLIGGLNMFDVPYLFRNGGGPDNATATANVFIYKQAYSGKHMYNRAAAASMLVFLAIAVCSAIIFYLMRDKDAAALKKMKKQERKNAAKRQEDALWH